MIHTLHNPIFFCYWSWVNKVAFILVDGLYLNILYLYLQLNQKYKTSHVVSPELLATFPMLSYLQYVYSSICLLFIAWVIFLFVLTTPPLHLPYQILTASEFIARLQLSDCRTLVSSSKSTPWSRLRRRQLTEFL